MLDLVAGKADVVVLVCLGKGFLGGWLFQWIGQLLWGWDFAHWGFLLFGHIACRLDIVGWWHFRGFTLRMFFYDVRSILNFFHAIGIFGIADNLWLLLLLLLIVDLFSIILNLNLKKGLLQLFFLISPLLILNNFLLFSLMCLFLKFTFINITVLYYNFFRVIRQIHLCHEFFGLLLKNLKSFGVPWNHRNVLFALEVTRTAWRLNHTAWRWL